MKYSSYDPAQAFNCVGSSSQSLPGHSTTHTQSSAGLRPRQSLLLSALPLVPCVGVILLNK